MGPENSKVTLPLPLPTHGTLSGPTSISLQPLGVRIYLICSRWSACLLAGLWAALGQETKKNLSRLGILQAKIPLDRHPAVAESLS